MRHTIYIIIISSFLFGCKDINVKNSEPDPCDLYQYLKGPFSVSHMEGTMTFSGGMKGNIEIEGLDYNDMTCTYNILDCTTGTADMNCDGAPYQTTLIMISKDEVKIGETNYLRVKS